jgi:hypothetical protein
LIQSIAFEIDKVDMRREDVGCRSGRSDIRQTRVRFQKENGMSETIERVARAIAEASGHFERIDDHHRHLARAAIEAMREQPEPEPRPAIYPSEWLEA